MPGAVSLAGEFTANSEPAANVLTESLVKDGAIVSGATTYNATDIKGFLVIAVGSGDWTLVTDEGSSLAFTPTAAYIGQIYPFHLTSITITASSEIMVFV